MSIALYGVSISLFNLIGNVEDLSGDGYAVSLIYRRLLSR